MFKLDVILGMISVTLKPVRLSLDRIPQFLCLEDSGYVLLSETKTLESAKDLLLLAV